MEKFVKFLILHKFYKYIQYMWFGVGVAQQYVATHRRGQCLNALPNVVFE